jgi:ferredoxin
MCVAECPVEAIVSENELSPEQQYFAQLNRELAQHRRWRRITKSKNPLPEHDKWATIKDKLDLLKREWK